jgi:1-acyl-sn-glycerol-3-phosphate acyltransferase
MVYKILKIWAQLAFSLYFRRIFISGTENIPRQGGVMILVNHPSSFLEPCIIAAFQHRNLHFLVRGDMFDKKWLLPLLKSTYQIPIYRMKDGFGKLRTNKSTFEQAYKVLADNHTLMMFPEASSELVKYLRPLQKGAGRLALGVFEETAIDELTIIPAGIHYFDATKSRNDVILKFGKPVSMKTWLLNNSETEDKLNALTNFFQEKMNEVVISILHPDHETVYNNAYIIAENEKLKYAPGGVFHTEKGYEFLNKLTTNLNSLPQNELTALGNSIDNYHKPHHNLRSFDASVTFGIIDKLWIVIMTILFFILGLPGFIVNAPSLFISKYFAKTKIRHITFYTPVRVAVNMGAHLVFSIILILILLNFFSAIQTILLFVCLQFSLFCFAIFIDYSRYAKYLFNIGIMKKRQALLKVREEILSKIN